MVDPGAWTARDPAEDAVLSAALARGWLTAREAALAARANAAAVVSPGRPSMLQVLARKLNAAQMEELRLLFVAVRRASGSDRSTELDGGDQRSPAAPEAGPSAHDATRAQPSGDFDGARAGGRAEPQVQPGARVGAYVLLERLGRGGMGVVYRAQHTSTGAHYALKTLTGHPGPTAIERFRREALAMAAVDRHPNVLRIHGTGEAQGFAYYVMDLAPGGDLAGRVARDGPLPADAVMRLGIELGSALAAVHARGILHRDLKPSNVMFAQDGRPLLADFGLAWIAGEDSLTKTGVMLGTPAYMPPEQVRAADLDARADVYGLAAILYHALTGAPPFGGEGSIHSLVAAILFTPAPPPSEQVKGVPRGLDAVLVRALAKDREERHASAGDLVADLERVARGEAPERRPSGRRAPVRGLAVAGLLLALGGGGAIWSQRAASLRAASQRAREVTRAAIEGAEAQARARRNRVPPPGVAPAPTFDEACAAQGEAQGGPGVADAQVGLEQAGARAAFDEALAAGALPRARELLEGLPADDGRAPREAALLVAEGREASALEALLTPELGAVARAEVSLWLARALLARGDPAAATRALGAASPPELALARAHVEARVLAARAVEAAGRMDAEGPALLGQAVALDAGVAADALRGAAEAALARSSKGRGARELVEYLAALRAASAGATLPPSASAAWLALAAEREAASDWEGFAAAVVAARRLSPDVALPEGLGVALRTHAGALLDMHSFDEGYAALLHATRAGLLVEPAIRSGIGEALTESGVLERGVREAPDDWAPLLWRGLHQGWRGLSARKESARPALLHAAEDLARVLAAAEVPASMRLQAEGMRLRITCVTQGVEAAVREVDRLAAAGHPEPWFLHNYAASVLWDVGDIEESVARSRMAIAAREARPHPDLAGGVEGDLLRQLMRGLIDLRARDEARALYARLEAAGEHPDALAYWRVGLLITEGRDEDARAQIGAAVARGREEYRTLERRLGTYTRPRR